MGRITIARRRTITAERPLPERTLRRPVAKRPIAERKGGRPSREAAAALAGVILRAATALFLRDGYAATSMEAVAATAGVSKRTLYARFPDKAALLQEAVGQLIADWLPGLDAALDHDRLEDALAVLGQRMLAAALTPEALALYRLLVAEAGRIPDLPRLLAGAGAGAGVARIAALLAGAGVADPVFAAEQFQRLVITGPQHRALGFGPPMDAPALEAWCRRCVALLLRGAQNS